MEGAPKFEKETEFEINKSPLKEAYVLLNARTPLELSNLYSREDQNLMKSGMWDYKNPDLVTNKIKNIIENVDVGNLNGEEKIWAQEILWFWYHHAVSCAVARYKDKKTAQIYAEKAIEMQHASHPNKITKLLFFLVNEQLPLAEEWAKEITEEAEKSTATDLIKSYKEKGFDFLK